MRRCSPSSPTASRGRARPWRLPLAPASAPCSGRSTRLLQQARCSRMVAGGRAVRSEEHTSELQSLMRISYAVFCLKKKTKYKHILLHNDSTYLLINNPKKQDNPI